MDSDLMKSILAGLIRYLLMSIFGGLIAAGYITESHVLVASGIVAGALIVVGSMVWRKVKTKYQLEEAVKLPAVTYASDVKEQVEKAKEQADKVLAKVAPITKILP